MKKHRLFVAVFAPDELINQYTKFYSNLKSKSGVKLVEPENLHLNLFFLGEAETKELAKITKALQEIKKRHGPFRIQVGGLLFFPKRERPRVGGLKVQKEKRLISLKKDINRVLGELGFKERRERFEPHITFARYRGSCDLKEKDLGVLEEINLEFMVEEFDLVESELAEDGPDYYVLEKIRLK